MAEPVDALPVGTEGDVCYTVTPHRLHPLTVCIAFEAGELGVELEAYWFNPMDEEPSPTALALQDPEGTLMLLGALQAAKIPPLSFDQFPGRFGRPQYVLQSSGTHGKMTLEWDDKLPQSWWDLKPIVGFFEGLVAQTAFYRNP